MEFSIVDFIFFLNPSLRIFSFDKNFIALRLYSFILIVHLN